MVDDGVYLRRVRDPNPILAELARQVVDALEDLERRGHRVHPSVLADTALAIGVPIAYVLDECERRARAGRTPEKSERADG